MSACNPSTKGQRQGDPENSVPVSRAETGGLWCRQTLSQRTEVGNERKVSLPIPVQHTHKHTNTHAHTCAYMHTHTLIHAHVHTYTHLNECTCEHMHTHIHAHACTHTYTSCMHEHAQCCVVDACDNWNVWMWTIHHTAHMKKTTVSQDGFSCTEERQVTFEELFSLFSCYY